jgi:hypothetical protein
LAPRNNLIFTGPSFNQDWPFGVPTRRKSLKERHSMRSSTKKSDDNDLIDDGVTFARKTETKLEEVALFAMAEV